MTERWILFDAVGTVIHPEPTAIAIYQQAAYRRGVTLDVAEIQGRFRQALHVHFAPDPTADDPWWTTEARERQRWQAIVSDTLLEVVAREGVTEECHCGVTCFEELWSHFRDAAHWRLDPAVPMVWSQLRAMGYQIAIASNFDSRLESICSRLAPLDSADRVFHSALLETRKPGLRFFRAIEHRLGISGEQATLVGDDWENDHQAARAAGWKAFWLTRQPATTRSASVLADLRDLPQYLQAVGQQQ